MPTTNRLYDMSDGYGLKLLNLSAMSRGRRDTIYGKNQLCKISKKTILEFIYENNVPLKIKTPSALRALAEASTSVMNFLSTYIPMDLAVDNRIFMPRKGRVSLNEMSPTNEATLSLYHMSTMSIIANLMDAERIDSSTKHTLHELSNLRRIRKSMGAGNLFI